MLEDLKELYRHRELLWTWTEREIRVRYKQSLMGSAWAILQPLSLMLIFTAVFSYLVQIPTDGIPYPLFSYSALLPWTFFSSSVSFAVTSLINNMNLVTKIYFPREVLPLANVGAGLFDFLIASAVFAAMMLVYQVPPYITVLWVPLLLALQVLLAVGISLIASAVVVFYRDVRFVVPLVLQLWLYATPVIYPASAVPQQWLWLYMLNPMAGLITAYRRTLLQGLPPDYGYLFAAAAVTAIVFMAGYSYFKWAESVFADVI